MADRGRWRPSVATRTALAAGLISAVLFLAAALWAREFVHAERIQAAEQAANDQLFNIVAAGQANRSPPGPGARHNLPDVGFEIVRSDGRVVDSSYDLKEFEGSGPVMPVPKVVGVEGLGTPRTVTFPEELDPAPGAIEMDPDPTDAQRLAGRTVTAFSDSRDVGIYTHRMPRGQAAIAVYVFVRPFEAEEAVAKLDRVLRPGLPAAVLLVMLVAYVATTVGLRPVERIRAQAAGITARDLHRRVPVPPTRDVVARLASTLNATLDRLERSSEQQRQFVADVAHELRSPVASLRAVLEVASEHRDRADWPAVTADAIADIQRLQDLLDDLLLLARFDADQPAPAEPLDLGRLVEQHVAGRPAYHGVTTTCQVGDQVVVNGNARELERLVRNLLDNAERHARSAVRIVVHRAGFDVVDDGPGIPPADRDRVFERFVRLDEARSRDQGGAGLGLSIARDITLRHQGTIVVDTAPAGGTQVSVRLPAA